MNVKEFNEYWDLNYPESNPIGHELRNVYPHRWFRIHSLPKAKRYAESEDEYNLILDRQNRLIADLVKENSEIILVAGRYEVELKDETSIEFSGLGKFDRCRVLSLHQIHPEEYENEYFYFVYFQLDVWKRNSKDELLKNIADGEFRAMIVCPESNCIVALYDGGVDVIVGSGEIRDQLKSKYRDWLSEREDGL